VASDHLNISSGHTRLYHIIDISPAILEGTITQSLTGLAGPVFAEIGIPLPSFAADCSAIALQARGDKPCGIQRQGMG
jgi:hypothetical protein